ncbi:MAG TPA: HAD family phosphatase [Candidatus Saccharimonadales bacterium]|nr:HAD family phosphatase [Candidatus Saccharimonadales bacterium]
MNKNAEYKAILFDFFDVIHADGFKRWLASREIPREGAMEQASVAMDSGKITEFEFENRIAEIAGISREQLMIELDSYRILNQEILPLMGKLGENYQIGLLSNASSTFLRRLLREHELEPYFHHIVISSEVGMIKPSPEIFEHILTKMKVGPKEAIFIDDNDKNVEAAEKLGITGIVFTDTKQLRRDLDALGIII